MNKELQDKLYADFPEIFQEHTLDMSETCMCWGLECGDGWEPIIREMCDMLQRAGSRYILKKEKFPYQYDLEVFLHNKCRKIERWFKLPNNILYVAKFDRYEKFPGFGVKFTQVKEKFGTLRVYHDVYRKFTKEEVAGLSEKKIHAAWDRYCGYVDGVIAFAEHMSGKICQNDGKPGKLYTSGWWHTVCTDCKKKQEKWKEGEELWWEKQTDEE
jgi:hypothetical protein